MSSTNSQIEKVISNTEKYEAYKAQMERLSKALKEGFYFEALLIDYALIEDRLVSYLYHMGVLPDRDKLKMGSANKNEIMAILAIYETQDDIKRLKLQNVSSKIMIVRDILRWASETTDDLTGRHYLKALKTACESVDVDGICRTLNDIDSWCKFRNEIIHGLMNKNVVSLNAHLQELAENGQKYARFLDKELRAVKKGNKVRKSLGL